MANPLPHEQQQQIADRIRSLTGILDIRQGELARRLHIDPANLSKALSLRIPLTNGLINSIIVNIGVRRDWILHGLEPVFEPEPEVVEVRSCNQTGTPVYDVDVCAGCTEQSMMFTDDRIIGRVSLPSLSPNACIIPVSGDSMEPVIRNGGFVAIRPISDPSNIFWGQIYVVVMDDYRMVKFLRRHPGDSERVVLHSANADYDDMDVLRSDIRRLFLVEAILNITIRC